VALENDSHAPSTRGTLDSLVAERYGRFSVMRARLLATVLLLAFAPGCGAVYYAAAVNTASSKVEEAREVGAEQLAPYEYYFAKEHLQQAQIEASGANYGDAANNAEVAEEYAGKAIELAQTSHKASGRE
jgi:hypothetical protein